MHARRTNIKFGDINLEVFQLPNGEYQLSISQVGLAIDKYNKSFREFLEGKSPEALLCKNYTFGEIVTEGAGRPIKGTPIKLAMLYWVYWANKGNVKAQALLAAGTEETLTRLADEAFKVKKAEQTYQQETSINMHQFETMFTMMQDIHSRLSKIDSMEEELKLLRPAYEKLVQIESTLDEYPNLKEALDYLIENAHKAKNTYSLAEWLKDNNLDFIPTNVRSSIGRLISSWCKLVEMKSPKGKYSDAFDPVLRFAVNYKLTRDMK